MSKHIMILLSSITFVVLIGVGIVVPILPSYAQGLGATATQVGLIFSGFSLSRTISTPIIGMIADRGEIKSFMLMGLFLYALIAITYVFATTPETLIMIRIFHGIASAFILPLAMSYIALIAKQGQEGLYMGSFNMALFLGLGSGPLIGGVITDSLGINAAFYCLSILSFISGILTLVLLPPMRSSLGGKAVMSLRMITRFSPMKGLLIFRVMNALGRGCLLAFVPILARGNGLSIFEIGVLISSNIFITGLLQRPFGMMVTHDNTIRYIVTGSFISALALASLPFGWDFLSFFTIGAVMGIGGAIAMPAASVMAVEYGRDMGMTSTMGVFEAARGVGMVLGPVISGVVMDISGIDNVFYVGGILIAIGTGVFIAFMRKTSL
jgi:DHA1 family multidrug resistance protein-like MFS transporter